MLKLGTMKVTKITPVVEIQAQKQATKEKVLEDRLNNLYAMADSDPDDWQIEEEIMEAEKQLKQLQDNR